MAGERIAVCVTGRLRALERTLGTLEEQVLSVLQGEPGNVVDVFVYAPQPNAAGVARFSSLFRPPTAVRAVRFDDEHHVLDMVARISQGSVLKQAMRVKGNWLGSAKQELLPGSHDRRHGTGLFQMYGHGECLDMIQSREKRAGVPYDRVITTRTDLRWLHPHPPLRALSPEFSWIPDTYQDDWGGVYDRHLVLPRRVAGLVLDGWRLLISGRAFPLIMELAREVFYGNNSLNTETWLSLRLMAAGARVARFPMTAYIACDIAEWGGGAARSPNLTVGSIHGTVHGFACRHGRDFRYPKEHRAVARFATCLSMGAGWTPADVWRCYCRGYSPEVLGEDYFALCQRRGT